MLPVSGEMLPVLMSALLLSGSPLPSPAPLKTIINVKTSAFCAQVYDLIIPFEGIRAQNAALRMQMARLEGELEKRNGSVFEPDWLAFFGSKMDSLATATAQNLDAADALLAQSWKQRPKGVNTKADAIRQRMQGVVDAERALNNAVLSRAAYAEDVQGFRTIAKSTIKPETRAAGLAPMSAPASAIQTQAAREDPFAHAAPAETGPPAPAFNRTLPEPGSFAQYLIDEEAAFESAAVQAAAQCGGRGSSGGSPPFRP